MNALPYKKYVTDLPNILSICELFSLIDATFQNVSFTRCLVDRRPCWPARVRFQRSLLFFLGDIISICPHHDKQAGLTTLHFVLKWKVYFLLQKCFCVYGPGATHYFTFSLNSFLHFQNLALTELSSFRPIRRKFYFHCRQSRT